VGLAGAVLVFLLALPFAGCGSVSPSNGDGGAGASAGHAGGAAGGASGVDAPSGAGGEGATDAAVDQAAETAPPPATWDLPATLWDQAVWN
jgi:hypothetical protein